MKKSILVLIILSLLLVGCGKIDNTNNEKKKTEVEEYDEVELKKDNISFTGMILDNGKLLILAKNSNEEDKEIRYEINFINKNKEKISTEKAIIYNIAGLNEAYLLVNNVPKEFDSYEIVPTIYDTNLENVLSDTTASSSDDKKDVKVTVNNKSDAKVSVDVGVVYYDKHDNIVGYEYDAGSIDSNKKKDFKILHPYDSDFNVLEYDHFEEVINQCYKIK